MKKYLMHPIYWIRLGLSYPVMTLGFLINDLSVRIYKVGMWVQDKGVAIEGEVPDGAW